MMQTANIGNYICANNKLHSNFDDNCGDCDARVKQSNTKNDKNW